MDDCCEPSTGALLGTNALNPTLSDKLKTKREGLEAELADIKVAEKILDENPNLKELFNLVSRVRVF